jgi:hypothetical protein
MSQWGGRWDRLAWGVLAAAMCVSALWLFDAGRNLTFSGDGSSITRVSSTRTG